MEKQEIVGYEPFINELKELIQKKQYRVLQTVNAETINLYWEIGVKFINSRKKMDGENPLYRYYQRNYRRNFQEPKVIRPPISGECVTFI